MTSLLQFHVSNDVTVVENNYFEVHSTPCGGNPWNDNMSQQPESYQQEHSPVYENLLEDIVSTVGYQETNSHIIPHTYYSQSGYPQGLLQNQPMIPCYQMQNGKPYGNFHPRPYRSQTNCVNTKPGLKAVTKRKRKRTMFTTEQIAVLEKVFLSKPYINRDERQALVKELQINDRVIKVWFQNRRLKEKREAEEAEQEMYSPGEETIEDKYQIDELSYIESQMNQTDKFGFVTLDDRAMNGLVSLIDNLLSKDAEVNLFVENGAGELPSSMQEESKGSAIYEPISPASSDQNSSDASTCYEPFEPKESLQRVFDIQEFLIFNKKSV